MNISNRDKMLLLIFCGIVIFLVAYLGVSKSYDSKTEAIQTQINKLKPNLNQLQTYNANLATYKSDIEKYSSSISSELSRLPTDVRTEDVLLYVTSLEKDLGITVNSVTVSEPQLVSRFILPQKTSDGYSLVPSAVLRSYSTLSYGLTYAQLKKFIAYVYNTPEMTTIKSIDVSYNAETGGLTGTVVLEKYFIAGTDYRYSKTTIPPVEKGNENLFGTFSVAPSTPAATKTN